MKTNDKSLISWFRGSFYFGIAFSLFGLGALIYEIVKNGNWPESVIGHIGIGLLFLYFSGRPMIDERIRFLKFKGLAIGFVLTTISASIINYVITFPDGNQESAFSSYWFALICLLVAFISFGILKSRE